MNRPREASRGAAVRRVVLVGRANVGKSVLFHALTGRYATVSNYPGTTLDLRRARLGSGLEIVDTPGLLSLITRTEDEAVARDVLLAADVDCVVHVASARDLAGALSLTMDLARLRLPMVLVLNLWDEARAKGIRIDVKALSRLLGVPVVPTVAVRGKGIGALKRAIERGGKVPDGPPLPAELRRAAAELEPALPEGSLRWGLVALTGGDGLRRRLRELDLLEAAEMGEVERLRRRFSRRPSFLFLDAARAYAEELAAQTSGKEPMEAGRLERALEALGRWSLRPVSGVLIAAAVLWGLYQFVGVFGAQTAVGFLEETLFGRYLNPGVSAAVAWAVPWAPLRDALTGPYGVFTMALTYALALILPIVATFFLAFGVLEDSGYLPRFSVVTDKLFRLIGLNGKAVLPMMLGLGCGTMAVMTTRILESRRERLLATLLLALTVPCSAQFGVILGMVGASTPAVFGVWAGVVGASLVVVGWAASRVVPGALVPFVIEIPPLRVPLLGNVLRKVGSRLRWYVAEVVPLFILATMILFLLDLTGGLRVVERFAAPVLQGMLGLPAEATGAFLTGFFRRDYGAAGLFHLHRAGMLEPRQVAVSLVCITLFMPCFAQWLIIIREHGWRATAAITAFVLAYSLSVAGLVNWAWRAAGG
ncbi:MAG: ferrous iron transport protein B [Elusimicrobiota bacterium]